jgi:hypothetical protein
VERRGSREMKVMEELYISICLSIHLYEDSVMKPIKHWQSGEVGREAKRI